MILSLAIAVVSATQALYPIDDIWVYPHATNQTEPFLRFWGSNGDSVPIEGSENGVSWSCIKFDVSKLPTGKTLVKATLTIWLVPDSGLTQADVDANPIEVRKVSPQFEEESFEFSQAKLVLPGGDSASLFGKASPKLFDNAKTGQKAEINLMVNGSTFAEYLKSAQDSRQKELGLALTSTIDPSVAGEGLIYKIFSTNAEQKDLRPKLELTFSD